jgi:hypothetical protein
MAGLRLEVQDFADLTRWRWVLVDEVTGALLADHEVRLDPGDWQFQAFSDLTGYMSWHVAPDRRREDEARIVRETGNWIGSEVFGPVADALVTKRPTTVRVVAPADAEELLYRPLELAHVDGKPLSVQDVTLVMQRSRTTDDLVRPVGERLRVLGLFSLPEGGRSLNLHQERSSLVRLVNGIAQAGKAAEIRVLQYGVTRARLRDVLIEAEGWDIIHISGHGEPGSLLLETAAGTSDPVTDTELADLLEPARGRVKLVTLSACWSGAVMADDQRQLLGLPLTDPVQPPERARDDAGNRTPTGAVASVIADRMDCAVLAMRYPVADQFAMALTDKLYDLLARQGEPLPRAVGMTMRLLSADPYPPLSVATPALFGGRAMDLRLSAPAHDGADHEGTAQRKMAAFPPPPERFIGRTAVMARASGALAEESGVPGVLIHGMPGGGKTACALELAYGHENAFDQLIWYRAPDEGTDVTRALTDFAFTLERALPGFQMAHLVFDTDHLTPFLPRLTELMERYRLLLVIDNAESLLSKGGQWHDDGWRQVIGALARHSGPGRLILTSRRAPPDLMGLRVEAVNALSADEALLLARELPDLSALARGEIPGIAPHLARRLTRHALELARGHPKLLELAEAQAAHPERLTALLQADDRARLTPGDLPDEFFTTGTTASDEDYLHVIAVWTEAAVEMLRPGERDLFRLLCCLEEPDRIQHVIQATWPNLWNRLEKHGQPPDLGRSFASVVNCGLVSGRDELRYAIHPGIARAGRRYAGKAFQEAVDAEASGYWIAIYHFASGEESDGTVHTGMMVRAALGAVPYLARAQQSTDIAILVEAAFLADGSRAVAAAMLPVISQMAHHDGNMADLQALLLEPIDPAAAEALMRARLDTAAAIGDYRAAWGNLGRLADICQDSGRLADALSLVKQQVIYAEKAHLGPWSQLLGEARQLQIMGLMGQADQVLSEVNRLRSRLDTLPAIPAVPGPGEAVNPWNVREGIYHTGMRAAVQLGRWQDALDLNAASISSMRERHATNSDIADAAFNDYFPMLRLDRADEALNLLLACRQAFLDARDIKMLGRVLSALAHTESVRGQGKAAVLLERDALRYKYLAGDAVAIAVSYLNLGHHLAVHTRQATPALANHLAAALIYTLVGIGGDGMDSANHALRAASTDFGTSGTAPALPTDIADLAAKIGDVPGTDLPRLIAKISPNPEISEHALRDLITRAQELATTPLPDSNWMTEQIRVRRQDRPD